jgi:hypothetical protein
MHAYESALERWLFRAINHRERLQARRRKNAGQDALPKKTKITKPGQMKPF